MKNFINEDKIFDILEKTQSSSRQRVKSIINKSLALKGLSPEEAAVLLNCDETIALNRIFETAKQIKETIYGNRLVLFAPLYLSNRCVNNCLYCGFRKENVNNQTRILDTRRDQDPDLTGAQKTPHCRCRGPCRQYGLFRSGD